MYNYPIHTNTKQPTLLEKHLVFEGKLPTHNLLSISYQNPHLVHNPKNTYAAVLSNTTYPEP